MLNSDEKDKSENAKKAMQLKAKYLIDKAKIFKLLNTDSNMESKESGFEKRAIWQPEEDDLILLIKVASLYFLPRDKFIPFKLVHDVMNALVPNKCVDKRVSSFGRRIKMLLKSNMNMLYVSNKLELCRQSKELNAKFAHAKTKITKNLGDEKQVQVYLDFVREIKEKFLKNKSYSQGNEDDHISDIEDGFELPATREEFEERFSIRNTTAENLFKNNTSFYYKQPTNDYEITCNTVHSAIHVN